MSDIESVSQISTKDRRTLYYVATGLATFSSSRSKAGLKRLSAAGLVDSWKKPHEAKLTPRGAKIAADAGWRLKGDGCQLALFDGPPAVAAVAQPAPAPVILAEPPPAPAVEAPPLAPTKPLIKWAGGKGRMLNSILPALPATFGRYFEPFAGGLALFFRLQPRGAYVADANQHLVRIYRAVRDHADDVIAALQEHKNDRAYYDRIKDDFNDGYGDDIWRAAALMYMNRAGFNGVCRFNGDGKYNVPFGDGKPKTLCDVENIRACSALLKQSTVEWADFRAVESVAQAGDLVFLDSPYLPESAGGFVNYTKEGFSAQDHEDVAALFRRLVARGVHVLASNSDTPRARELYSGFEIRTLYRSNSVNSKASARGSKPEILVLGGTWTPRGAS